MICDECGRESPDVWAWAEDEDSATRGACTECFTRIMGRAPVVKEPDQPTMIHEDTP